jgi:chromosome segregation ATPase
MAEQRSSVEELRKELKKAVEELKAAVEKLKELRPWDTVCSIAEDVLAYMNRRIDRFVIKILQYGSGGTCIVNIYGVDRHVDRYAHYDVSSEITLKQLVGQFFDDVNVLIRMLYMLAAEISRAAQRGADKIRELEGMIRGLETRIRDLELESEDP